MKLIINKEKFETFLKVAKMLNKKFHIEPILFGSLGLNRVIGEHWKSNDIDLIVPNKIISKELVKLKVLMKSLGFILKDRHEHDFERKGEIVSFGRNGAINDVKKIIGSDIKALKISGVNGVKFKEFSAKHYLAFYSRMLRDNYRQEKRGNADKEKVIKIKEYLNQRAIKKIDNKV